MAISNGFHIFFKLCRCHSLGAFSKGFADPFLKPKWWWLKSRGELWQADSESLPDDIGLAQLGDSYALGDLRINLIANIHFGQSFHIRYFNVYLPLGNFDFRQMEDSKAFF